MWITSNLVAKTHCTHDGRLKPEVNACSIWALKIKCLKPDLILQEHRNMRNHRQQVQICTVICVHKFNWKHHKTIHLTKLSVMNIIKTCLDYCFINISMSDEQKNVRNTSRILKGLGIFFFFFLSALKIPFYFKNNKKLVGICLMLDEAL